MILDLFIGLYDDIIALVKSNNNACYVSLVHLPVESYISVQSVLILTLPLKIFSLP